MVSILIWLSLQSVSLSLYNFALLHPSCLIADSASPKTMDSLLHLVVARPGTGCTMALKKLSETVTCQDEFTVLPDNKFEVSQSDANDLFTGDVFAKLVRRMAIYRASLFEHDTGDSFVVVEKGAATFFHVDCYLIYSRGLITPKQYIALEKMYESLFSPVVKYKGRLNFNDLIY